MRALSFAVDDAETVRDEVAGELIEVGAKVQVIPGGSPEHESATACVNPLSALSDTVVDPDCPGDTLSDAGTSEKEKSGGGKWIV